MARRFNPSLHPVHRIKHVIDQQAGLIGGTQQRFGIITAVDAPVLANPTEVETGSKVNGIYLKIEGYATAGGALSNLYMYVYKNSGNNLQASSIPDANVVGTSDNKKFVFHQEMIMMQQQTFGNPRTLFQGVIVIPKGMRRQGINDSTEIAILSPGVNASVCFQCIYKEFR